MYPTRSRHFWQGSGGRPGGARAPEAQELGQLGVRTARASACAGEGEAGERGPAVTCAPLGLEPLMYHILGHQH